MITRLYADNFRTLVNFELKFDRLNLLMGPNGSGKSSVFSVLRRLQQFNRGEGKIGGIFSLRDLTRWQNQSTQRFELDVSLPEGEMRYLLVVEFNAGEEKCRVLEETLSEGGLPLFDRKLDMVRLYRDDHSPGPTYPFDWTLSALATIQARHDNTKLSAFRRLLNRLVIAAISPSQMETNTQDEAPTLSARMENFASWYRKLSQENMGAMFKLFQELKAVLPGFESFSFKEAGQDTKTFNVEFSRRGSRKLISYYFSELSDGQRVLIALYTLIHGLNEEGLCLFLDEPDNFVSLREIQPWLASLQDNVEMAFNQAVMISHHPEIINHLGNTRGRWLSRDEEGKTRVKDDLAVDNQGVSLSEIVARGWQE